MGGSSIGILFGAQSLGASVAPLIGGVIADRWGLPTAAPGDNGPYAWTRNPTGLGHLIFLLGLAVH